MDAIILAAGMGRRLKSVTKDKTKCMITVNGTMLIDRMLGQLDELNLDRIIIVVGYQSDKLINHISTLNIKTDIEYVFNDIYDKTNNIYSLFLAKHYLENSDCLILEADLIFDDGILENLVNDEHPNLALVAKFESWMDGTVVTIDDNNNIINFYSKDQFSFENIKNYFKTVNIYKFSKEFSNHYYIPFLEAYTKSVGYNAYYEQVLKIITNLHDCNMKIKRITDEKWYEIDNVQDLDIAESIFAESAQKVEKISSRKGGYWRYPNLIDFTNFSNPYFPPETLISEIKSNFEDLIGSYPSNIDVNSLLVSKYFNIDQKNICVGNGVYEIVKYLFDNTLNDNSKVGMIRPSNEYSSLLNCENIIYFDAFENDFKYGSNDLISFFDDKDLGMLMLINPDTISGNYMAKNDLEELIKWADNQGIILVIDESYINLVDMDHNSTLLFQEILDEYTNLCIIKDVSGLGGIAGLGIGVLNSGNTELIKNIKTQLPLGNISSFAEFYLQIFEKYSFEYDIGINRLINSRKNLLKDLKKIDSLKVIPSQSFAIICEVTGEINSSELTEILLNDYDILIEDLANHDGFNGKSYIRMAIRNQDDNSLLVEKLSEILN